MPKKYHIHPEPTPLDLEFVSKFKIVRGENCINCGKCTKVCIYEAHKRRQDDPRQMADPNTVLCRNCFRCIQECPRGALEKSLDRDFVNIGGPFWQPDMLLSLWKQAEDGKVPVSGAGYRGPFTGRGFDGMWTDMSEIVRPTRDGIHGREYIRTSVDLGRKLNHLDFDADGQLASEVPDTVDLPIPIIFDTPPDNLSANIRMALVKAAAEIGTCVIMPAADVTSGFEEYRQNIIPCLQATELGTHQDAVRKARLVALEYSDVVLNDLPGLLEDVKRLGRVLTIIRVKAGPNVEDIVAKLARRGAEIVHIVADYCGREFNEPAGSERRSLKDVIRAVHLRLVEDQIRDEVTLVASGGIAMAEHVPKAMLCGADLTAIDIPLMIALGARLYEIPQKELIIPEELDRIPIPIITQRMVNLMGAWHSQILEVMGAMGIREARRLRGESGRAIFFEDVDKDTFGKLFEKDREAVGL
jgi:ferredoxin